MTLSQTEIIGERRRGRIAAAAAIGAGLLIPGGILWSQVITRDGPKGNAPALLRFFDSRATELVAAAVIESVGIALLIVVALHLTRATKDRNPELPQVVTAMAVFGPAAFALSSVARSAILAVLASDFAGRGFQTIKEAEDVLQSPALVISGIAGFAGVLALGFWFVLGALNAMRVGLLTRFMGVLGIIVGPAFVLGLTPVILSFWLLAVGALFLGFWPGGRPPAWDAGKAIPWPSAGRLGEGRRAGGSRDGEVEAVGTSVKGPGQENDGSAGGGENAGGAPRKRKRRR